MRTRLLPFAGTAGIAVLIVLAACSGPAGAGSASASATQSAAASASSSEAATTTYQVKVGKTSAGNALVGEDGKTLYFFAKDATAGQTGGEGVAAFGAKWFALSSSGTKVTPPSSGGGGYGYH